MLRNPGFLYMADAYYDGWSAKVNGQASHIYVANYGFRAVAIPAAMYEFSSPICR
jgi:uncharacterized membrane protein YfhO